MTFHSKKSILRLILFHRLRIRFLILLTSFLAAFLGILAPYFQKEFIDTLTSQTQSKIHFFNFSNSWTFVLFAFVSYLLSQAFSQWTTYLGMLESIRMQRILAEKLYKKMLSLKVDTLSQRPLGEIVAMYATDIPGSTVLLEQTLPSGASTLFPLIIAPFVLIMIFDTPLWPTFLTMALVSAFNTTLAFRQSKFFYRFKQLAAKRIGLVNEWIQNIKTLRVLGWTQRFEQAIFGKRVVETDNRMKMLTNGQVMNSISSSFTFILNVITLGLLVVVYKQNLTSGEILALLWILGVFLTRPFRQMPWFFTFAFDAWTSVNRLEDFMSMKNEISPSGVSEAPGHLQEKPTQNPTKTQIAVESPLSLEVKNMNLNIRGHQILRKIDLKIHHHEFVAIVGDVGAGKSLLLLSLLDETGASWDKFSIGAGLTLSFVPQEAFIMSATLRDNIIFDYDQDQTKDSAVKESLRSCQFQFNQERISHGLDTEIGERGVNLSGGQKQRINLARVDYNQGHILLLDDCFSALDVDTEKLIMEKLLLERWKNKTRILVTHRLSVLEKVDRILFMDQGQIVDEGTFNELRSRSPLFQAFTQSLHYEIAKEVHVEPANAE